MEKTLFTEAVNQGRVIRHTYRMAAWEIEALMRRIVKAWWRDGGTVTRTRNGWSSVFPNGNCMTIEMA